MTSANGRVKAKTAERVVEAEVMPAAKVWLNHRALKPRDLIRAREVLKDVLGGRPPVDLLDPDQDEHWAFLIWCQRSRTDPLFSWDDALDTDFDECVLGDERPPPPIPPLELSGSSESLPSGNGSSGNESSMPPSSPDDEPSSARSLT